MLPALLASGCFAFSVVFAHRSARILGGIEANFWRLIGATIFLGTWAFGWGQGLTTVAFPILFLSGIIGIGIGDIGLFQALPRIGPRLSLLLIQCLTAPFAALIEWLWLGARLTPAEIFWAGLILAGIGVSLAPGHAGALPRKAWVPGVAYSLLGALGGALGAVLSRQAYAILAREGETLDWATAAFQRLVGGLLTAAIMLLIVRGRQVRTPWSAPGGKPTNDAGERWRRAWPWVLANSLAGQTIGVTFYQWAFATTRTGIVLPIVAMSPLLAMPITRVMNQEPITLRALAGGAVAVAGVIGLALRH